MTGELSADGVDRSDGVGTDEIVDALRDWRYSTRPSSVVAFARYLSRAFPHADVRRGVGRGEATVVVDGVGVELVAAITPGFDREVRLLADQYDDLVCYSATAHHETPTDWVEFVHRNDSESVEFHAHRSTPTDDAPVSSLADAPTANPVAAVALLATVMAGTVGVLASSLGLFSTADTALGPTGWALVGATGAVALVVAVTGYWLHRHVTVESTLARLAQ